MLAGGGILIETARFKEKRNKSGEEEDGNIHPIGRSADRAVVGIKKHGNERKPKSDAARLDAKEVLAFLEEKALHESEEEARPEKQLHMLEGGFVHAREGRDPERLAEPFV